MQRKDVKVGDKVTCLRRKEAYYSGYSGRVECWFEPGTVGTVAAVDVPSVYPTRQGKELSFCCVDFQGPDIAPGKFSGTTGRDRTTWRVSLHYDNIKKL